MKTPIAKGITLCRFHSGAVAENAQQIWCARPRNSGAATMAVIWLLYAEAVACDPGEARGHFYGRAGCAELSQFLTLSALVLAAT